MKNVREALSPSMRLVMALHNLLDGRPNKALAERQVFRVVGDHLDDDLLLASDDGWTQLPSHVVELVKETLGRYLDDDQIEQINYWSADGAAPALARVTNPNRTENPMRTFRRELPE